MYAVVVGYLRIPLVNCMLNCHTVAGSGLSTSHYHTYVLHVTFEFCSHNNVWHSNISSCFCNGSWIRTQTLHFTDNCVEWFYWAVDLCHVCWHSVLVRFNDSARTFCSGRSFSSYGPTSITCTSNFGAPLTEKIFC